MYKRQVCRTLGIRIIDVARKDYFQKLGTLAQIQGFTREAKKYDGPEFPADAAGDEAFVLRSPARQKSDSERTGDNITGWLLFGIPVLPVPL